MSSASAAQWESPELVARAAGVVEPVEALIARLDHQVRHGDAQVALAEAAARVRAEPDARLEHALVQWRRLSFARLPVHLPQGAWPPSFNDPFPGLAGVPEISGDQLTTEILGGALQHHGSLLVRGLLSSAKAQALCADLDQAFAVREAMWAGAAPAEISPWYSEVELSEGAVPRPASWDSSGLWTADSPRNHAQWVDLFELLGIIDVIGGYFGERPVLSVGKTNLRKVPLVTGTDWHQDGAFLGPEVRAVNVWIALTACGVEAAGLDIIGRRLPYVLQTGSHGALFDWSVGPGMVELLRQGGAQVASPVFEAGDAVLFDHFMLHRTGMRPGLTKMRYASENWFFAPSSYADRHEPIVI